MECPHLVENVKFLTPCLQGDNPPIPWTCKVCKTDQSPWICLFCGNIHCGRYVNGHAKSHHEEQVSLPSPQPPQSQEPPQTVPSHCVCLDCDSWAVYCYICDEFVVNDTECGQIDKVRKHLQALLSVHNQQQQQQLQPQQLSSSSQPNNMSTEAENSCKENVESVATTSVASCSRNNAQDNGGNSDSNSSSSYSQKENRQMRRRNSSESRENNKKRIKMDDGSSAKVKIKAKTPGLRNLGNTCFMNAVLQSLSNIQSFCGYIKQLPSLEPKLGKKKIHTRSCKEGEDIFVVEELRKTMVALWGGSKSAISPECLFSVIWKVVPRFRGYQQQDAHEFMRYLLDRLHTELLTLLPYPNSNSPFIGPKGKSTIVTNIFGGLLQNEVMCLMCGTESKKHDPFLDLSLDIPPNFSAKCPSPKNGEPVCHLHDCLSSFTDIEELEETELYMCNNCKQRQRSTKKFWIRRLPNVLCLHLKRFRWNTYFRVKVDTYIEFPMRGLDMNKYMLNNLHETRNSCGGSNEYDLAAVIVHHGSGAGSGHYTSYATHEGRWYHFNDSSVSCVEEEVVTRCKAYILFYVKRDIKVPAYFSAEPQEGSSSGLGH